MTKLPNGWEIKKLGEIAKITSGGTPSRSNNEFWENGSIPWVKIKDMKEDYIKSTEEFITDLGLSNSSAKLFPKGTLLYSIFATLGEVGILDINAATNQAIAGIAIKQDDINAVFMMYYLKSIKNEVIKKGRGVAQNNLNISMLKELEVPLPSLEEQRKIVKILDEKFASIDESIRLAKDDLLSLDELWQSILNDSFNPLKSKPDNDTYTLPPTWKWEKLGDITEKIGDGLHGTPIYSDDGEYYFINGGSLTFSHICIDNHVKKVSKDEFLKYNKPLSANSVLVSINGTLGKTAFYNSEKVVLGKSICYINVKNTLLSKYYLLFLLNSMYFVKYAHKNATGSAVKNVPLKAIRNFAIPLPPLEEQERIAKELESKAKTIKELKELYTKRLKDYEELKESLLDLAFKGGL